MVFYASPKTIPSHTVEATKNIRIRSFQLVGFLKEGKKSLHLLLALRLCFSHWQLRFPHALSIAIFVLNSSSDGQKTEAVWLVLSASGGWGGG